MRNRGMYQHVIYTMLVCWLMCRAEVQLNVREEVVPMEIACSMDFRFPMSFRICAANLLSAGPSPSSSFAVSMCFSCRAARSMRNPSSWRAAFATIFNSRSVT